MLIVPETASFGGMLMLICEISGVGIRGDASMPSTNQVEGAVAEFV